MARPRKASNEAWMDADGPLSPSGARAAEAAKVRAGLRALGLTPQQTAAAIAWGMGRTDDEAAEAAGVDVVTLGEWLITEPGPAMIQLAKHAMVQRLYLAECRGLQRLVDIFENDDAKPADRMQAVGMVFSRARGVKDEDEMDRQYRIAVKRVDTWVRYQNAERLRRDAEAKALAAPGAAIGVTVVPADSDAWHVEALRSAEAKGLDTDGFL